MKECESKMNSNSISNNENCLQKGGLDFLQTRVETLFTFDYLQILMPCLIYKKENYVGPHFFQSIVILN